MKKLFLNFLLSIAFILYMALSVSAQGVLNISSVLFDSSAAFLVLNSADYNEVKFESKPIKTVFADENKIYIDIPQMVLSSSNKNMVIKSKDINEISVIQLTKDPEVVRVIISYNPTFNPDNLSLKRLGNSLFICFSRLSLMNYYFHANYSESKQNPFYENIEIQNKIMSVQSSLLGQINSAFNLSVEDYQNNYILAKNNLYLPSKYYLDNVTIRDNIPIVSGVGAYTISRPIYLTNPSRVAYDVYNTVVNPAIRNHEIPFGDSEKIKIGQFDHNTARIVITSLNPEKYIPVVYADAQRLVFIDSAKNNSKKLYTNSVSLTAVKYENTISGVSSAKFMFSAPLIYGVNRTQNDVDVYLYNLGDFSDNLILSELKNSPFNKVKVLEIKNKGVVLKFPASKNDVIDLYLGSDGKTLRIKQKFFDSASTEVISYEYKEANETPVILNRDTSKKYVILDAGHGGSDHGAIRSGISEKDITLDVTQRVEKLLIKKGYVVAMTRTDDSYVSLQDRVEASEIFNPDLFISIHVNSSNSDNPNGIETHYYKENSLQLAKCIHASMLNNINAHDRGLFKSKFYVINHTTAPAILVEMGFLSNPDERAQIMTESRRAATAKAIVEGIDEYFKE